MNGDVVDIANYRRRKNRPHQETSDAKIIDVAAWSSNERLRALRPLCVQTATINVLVEFQVSRSSGAVGQPSASIKLEFDVLDDELTPASFARQTAAEVGVLLGRKVSVTQKNDIDAISFVFSAIPQLSVITSPLPPR